MLIYFDEDKTTDQKTAETMNKAAALAAEAEKLDSDRLSVCVSFVDKEEIKALNGEYRGKDEVTDVLSFPQFEDLSELSEEAEEIALGDVVICEARAREQAEEFGHSYERELIYLFVHSVMHLLGYDHMTDEDKAEMRAKEENVMSALGITRD